MKLLYIIRHAKSDWADSGIHDVERPLAQRGLRDAPVMAEVLKKRGQLPDMMITSPALRAFTTCRIFCKQLGFDTNDIVIEPDFYHHDIKKIDKILQSAFAEVDKLAIFGHNPTFTELARYYTPEFGGEMPTCSIVAIHFDDQQNINDLKGNGKLLWFEYPKNNR